MARASVWKKYALTKGGGGGGTNGKEPIFLQILFKSRVLSATLLMLNDFLLGRLLNNQIDCL